MKALRFKLSGRTACFRRAEFNAYAYFTYNNIHKPALLGMLGAILGYGGYSQQKKEEQYPEYYQRLKEIKVSIVPLNSNKGVFSKKIQAFNNSVGYALTNGSRNLVVREQWLENPCWYIYILDDGSHEYNKLKEFLLEGKAFYIPYLGKNDHTAQITETTIVDMKSSESRYIDSIVVGDNVKYGKKIIGKYMVKETVPVKLDEEYNFAVYEKSFYTNLEYDRDTIDMIYSDGKYRLFFF